MIQVGNVSFNQIRSVTKFQIYLAKSNANLLIINSNDA